MGVYHPYYQTFLTKYTGISASVEAEAWLHGY